LGARALVAAAFLVLQGCGGYYTRDMLYAPEPSDGWVNTSDINRSSKFECNRRSIRYVSSSLSSKKTAEGIFGVPVIPTDDVIVKEDLARNLRFLLAYEGTASAVCTTEDAAITIPGIGRVVPSAARGQQLTKTEHYCVLIFDVAEHNAQAFLIHVSPGKLGCDVPPLAVRRSTVNTYHYSPW